MFYWLVVLFCLFVCIVHVCFVRLHGFCIACLIVCFALSFNRLFVCSVCLYWVVCLFGCSFLGLCVLLGCLFESCCSFACSLVSLFVFFFLWLFACFVCLVV